MTYDQAQSPRLGQRTPVESTYVRMFTGSELPEVSWPGQVIFRTDTRILQVYDGAEQAWTDVAGGVPGQLTFVGPEEPVAQNIGDTWYDSDNLHRLYVWDGAAWQDPAAAQDNTISETQADVVASIDALTTLSVQVDETAALATSAQNSADTADGRVSMSDYEPGPDDIPGRVNGSIWFTRTRPRQNQCTNPSFEVDTTGWASALCTITREAMDLAPAGDYVLNVVNNATVDDHTVTWSTQTACVEGQAWTASAYVELVSGVGAGVYAKLNWYNDSAVFISSTAGETVTLVVDAFVSAALGTITEPRVWVTGEAPTGAVSFTVTVVSPDGNESDEWRMEAVLIEQEDDLGRYFDGGSYDCAWEGTAHASVSTMDGHKIVEIHELRDQDWVRKYLDEDVLVYLTTDKLVGSLDGALLEDNSVTPDKLWTQQVVASEDLTAGNLVHVWNDSGVQKVRKASATNRYEAHGFVLDTVSSGGSVRVYNSGYDHLLSDLSPGNQWLSLVAGESTSLPPSSVNTIVQRVGFAVSETILDFSAGTAIKVT